jgi:NADH:ubiquinone oxidoreductase subunit E/ferredoxin
MSFTPVLVMNGILLVVTVLLAVADRVLVSYGDCKLVVTQDDDRLEAIVPGGNYLHTILSENGVKISSSCGGKATCGYCKVRVLSGGGPILPTEEIFMDRQEKLEGMRLACQVKIKSDIEVVIPDFLTTVRNMVKKGTFDSKIKWRLKMSGQTSEEPDEEDKKKVAITLTAEDKTSICGIIEKCRDPSGSVVPVLQQVNEKFNYLSENSMRLVSQETDVPLSSIYRLASFYNAFSLTPMGKYVITVCTGTACHVKGVEKLLQVLEAELAVKREETTEDMLFTLKTVRCIGCCGLAPVLKIGEEVHGLVNKKKGLDLVKKRRKKEAELVQA